MLSCCEEQCESMWFLLCRVLLNGVGSLQLLHVRSVTVVHSEERYIEVGQSVEHGAQTRSVDAVGDDD